MNGQGCMFNKKNNECPILIQHINCRRESIKNKGGMDTLFRFLHTQKVQ